MYRLMSFVLVVLVFSSAIAIAHDVSIPDWRNQNGTTYQHWTFDDGDDPAAPEFMNNTYGGASADITLGDFSEGWQYQLGGMGSQTGYWDLGSTGGSIVLGIFNRPEPLEYKEIWLQVTYYQGISAVPDISVTNAAYLGGNTILIEDTGMGEGWYLNFSKWRIEPNPSWEEIIITSDAAWGSVIDQIVVDTICIPEPMSLALLAIGALMTLRKKRR